MSGRYLQIPGGQIAVLGNDCPFPSTDQALDTPDGLLAIGGDLSISRLLDAYQHGIFPWFNEDQPILWWSPSSRMVFYPEALKVSRSMHKRLKKQDYEIRVNHDFEQVIRACANTPRPGQNGTWITEDMITAYLGLHTAGYAHCLEVWMDDKLVGGIYGVRIGAMFFAESMFHHVSNASKIALIQLVRLLQSQGVKLIDCQMKTEHLASMGASEIPRAQFLHAVQELTAQSGVHQT